MKPEELRAFLLECELRVGKMKILKRHSNSAPCWDFDDLYVKVPVSAVRGKESLRIKHKYRADAANTEIKAPSLVSLWSPFYDVPDPEWKKAVFIPVNAHRRVTAGIRAQQMMRPELNERLQALDGELLWLLNGTKAKAKALVADACTGKRNVKFVKALQEFLQDEGVAALGVDELKTIFRINPYALRRMTFFMVRHRYNIKTMLDDDVDEAVRLAQLQKMMEE